MPAPSPLTEFRKKVSRFLGDVSMLTEITDDSLVAETRRLTGRSIDRTTFVRWRAGDRGAPLELFWLLMSAADQSERVAIGNLLLGQFGLKVVDAQQQSADHDLMREAVMATTTAGRLTQAVFEAQADGVVDEAERLNLRAIVGELSDQARSLLAATSRKAS